MLRVFLIGFGSHSNIEYFWPPLHVNNKNNNGSNNNDKKMEIKVNNKKMNVNGSVDDIKITNHNGTGLPGLKPDIKSQLDPNINGATTPNITTTWTFENDFKIYGIEMETLAKALKPPQSVKFFQIKIDHTLFLSYSTSIKISKKSVNHISNNNNNNNNNNNDRNDKKSDDNSLDGFTIVFAFDLNKMKRINETNKKMWCNIIKRYIRVLLYEQKRINYLVNNVYSLRLIKYKYITNFNESHKNSTNTKASTLKSNSLPDIIIENGDGKDDMESKADILSTNGHHTQGYDSIKANNKNKNKGLKKKTQHDFDKNVTKMLIDMRHNTKIGNDIAKIVETLMVEDELKILINDWIWLDCSLKTPNSKDYIIKSIRPYHTLLILPQKNIIKSANRNDNNIETKHNKKNNNNNNNNASDTSDAGNLILKTNIALRGIIKDAYHLTLKLPSNGSESLKQMILKSNVCRSFGELASLTSIPLPTIYHLAFHLVYWKHALIITTLNNRTKFKINPNINLKTIIDDETMKSDFKYTFPHLNSIAMELCKFNKPTSLSNLMKRIKHRKMSDINTERETLIFLITWFLQRKLLIRLYLYIDIKPAFKRKMDQYNNNIIPINEDERMFDSLIDLFNGKNHFEEIIFQSGLSGKELDAIIDRYDDRLIKFWHSEV